MNINELDAEIERCELIINETSSSHLKRDTKKYLTRLLREKKKLIERAEQI